MRVAEIVLESPIAHHRGEEDREEGRDAPEQGGAGPRAGGMLMWRGWSGIQPAPPPGVLSPLPLVLKQGGMSRSPGMPVAVIGGWRGIWES